MNSSRARDLLVPCLSIVALLTGCATAAEGLDVAELAVDTSPFQQGILADGVVTPAEYEKAILAHRQCVADTGAEVGEVYEIANNQLTFDWEVEAPSLAEVDAINAEADECLPEYRDAVGLAWAEQEVLSPAEKEALQPQVVSCLESAGVDLAGARGFEEIVASVREYQDAAPSATADDPVMVCVSEFPEYFMVSILDGD